MKFFEYQAQKMKTFGSIFMQKNRKIVLAFLITFLAILLSNNKELTPKVKSYFLNLDF